VPGSDSLRSEDPTQPEHFGDDYSQPDAADGEPVFWSASGNGHSVLTGEGNSIIP
jgi:hypothetical protein